MSSLSHIGAGLIGAGITLIGVGIYIKKYHENSKDDNIELKCPIKNSLIAKNPIKLTDLKTTSPLFTSIGNLEHKDQQASLKLQPQSLLTNLSLPAGLDSPVLPDFAKLEAPAQNVENCLDLLNSQVDNFATTVLPTLDEKDAVVQYGNNTIIILADMKLKNDPDVI